MATISITASDVSFSESGSENSERLTKPAAEAITAGQYVREDSTGQWVLGNATSAGEVGTGKKGIALESVAVGETLTVLVRGILDLGDVFGSQGIDDVIYLDDTDGTLADAAGTVTKVVGYITGIFISTTVRKVLFVDAA